MVFFFIINSKHTNLIIFIIDTKKDEIHDERTRHKKKESAGFAHKKKNLTKNIFFPRPNSEHSEANYRKSIGQTSHE